MWNKILRITGLSLSIAALFVLLVAAVSTSREAKLKKVLVNIDYAGEHYFVEKEDIEEAIFDLGYLKD